MSIGYESPTSGPGGDDAADDAAGKALTSLEESSGHWEPECWSKSPEQLQEEARAQNMAAFAHISAHATKHSNPPAPPSRDRLL